MEVHFSNLLGDPCPWIVAKFMYGILIGILFGPNNGFLLMPKR